MKQKYLIIAIIFIILVGGGLYFYTKHTEPVVDPVNITPTNRGASTNTNTNKNSNTTVAGNPNQIKGKNILNVGPQNSGDSLIVDLVNSVKPGFIAVYQADGKGQAGKLVGSSELIPAGTRADLVVKAVLRANTTYVISLREDDGDGKFNPTKDTIVNDVQGKPVTVNITTGK